MEVERVITHELRVLLMSLLPKLLDHNRLFDALILKVYLPLYLDSPVDEPLCILEVLHLHVPETAVGLNDRSQLVGHVATHEQLSRLVYHIWPYDREEGEAFQGGFGLQSPVTLSCGSCCCLEAHLLHLSGMPDVHFDRKVVLDVLVVAT